MRLVDGTYHPLEAYYFDRSFHQLAIYLMCRKCVIEEENLFHVLFECKALTDLRQEHLTQGYQMMLPSEKLTSGHCCSSVRAQVFCEMLSVVGEQLANKSLCSGS